MKHQEFMALAERQYWNALAASGMSMAQIAAHAGLNRTSLYRRFERIGINPEQLPRKGRYGHKGNWQGIA